VDAQNNQIRGECTLPNYQNDIDVQEWSWGYSAAAGIRNILIKKSVDLASPQLATKAQSRDQLTGTLTILDGANVINVTLYFEGATVDEVDVAGTAVPLQEAVTLRINTASFGYKNEQFANLTQPVH
jgi:type VI protein secretion system component Hcp